MSQNFTVITPDAPEYDETNAILDRHTDEARRIDYDALAEQYNEAVLNSVVILEDTADSKAANVYTVLKARGLQPKIDVLVSKPTQREDGASIPRECRSIFVKKLSTVEMQILHKD